MKKQMLNLGKALNKAEQKAISVGDGECPPPYVYNCGKCYPWGATYLAPANC